MKKFFLYIALLFSFLFSSVNASFWDDLTDKSNPKTPYCQDNNCSLEKWIEIVKAWINDIEKERTASEYAQDLTAYVLNFITIVAVFYILYSWFALLTSAWDEEKSKKTKSIIVYVILWIVVIWMASPIVTWLIELLNLSQ